MSKNTLDLQKNIEKLSTGFRINRAADDAAGLSISEKLSSRIRGLAKAEQNIGDAISMLQTAEGALSIVQDNLQRLRELVVQAENGTNGLSELNAIQREIIARLRNIDDVSRETEFNNINLLDNSAGVISFQTGADDGQTTSFDFSNLWININGNQTMVGSLSEGTINFTTLKVTPSDVNAVGTIASPQLGTLAPTGFPLANLDLALDNVSRMRSDLGALQNSLESKAQYLNIARENAEASRSRIKDVDVALESSILVKNQILQQASSAMLSQANQTPQLALNLLP